MSNDHERSVYDYTRTLMPSQMWEALQKPTSDTEATSPDVPLDFLYNFSDLMDLTSLQAAIKAAQNQSASTGQQR